MIAAYVFALAAGVFSGRENQLHVPAPRLDAPAAIVRVDGVLDEEAWRQAALLTGFSQYAPVDGRPAVNQTDVLVFYSATTIYFGVKPHAAPGAVHATLANRDRIEAADAIQIFLNPFNDGRQALVFGVNPLGIQADGALVEGTGNRGGAVFGALESGREVTDLTPDYVFQSRGRLTDYGYEVEIAIPFKTLRFPAGRTQSWALNVFFEWSPANIVFATYSVDWRPNEKLRIDTQYQLQSYERRSDGSTVGVRRIPRLKVEYQGRPLRPSRAGRSEDRPLPRNLAGPESH